jgi:hypothetical protein
MLRLEPGNHVAANRLSRPPAYPAVSLSVLQHRPYTKDHTA